MLSRRVLFVLSAVLLVAAAAVSAGTYVSLNGDFFVEYPESWTEVAYEEARYAMLEKGNLTEMPSFDAVFARAEVDPFYNGPYVVLSLDLVGKLQGRQIDSVLITIGGSFFKLAQNLPMAEFLERPSPNAINYDVARNEAVLFRPEVDGHRNIIWLKFYDRGIATFFAFTPDSLFDDTRMVVERMAASFSTDQPTARLPQEKVTLATDLDTREPIGGSAGSIFTQPVFLLSAAALLVIVIVLIVRSRRSARAKH